MYYKKLISSVLVYVLIVTLFPVSTFVKNVDAFSGETTYAEAIQGVYQYKDCRVVLTATSLYIKGNGLDKKYTVSEEGNRCRYVGRNGDNIVLYKDSLNNADIKEFLVVDINTGVISEKDMKGIVGSNFISEAVMDRKGDIWVTVAGADYALIKLSDWKVVKEIKETTTTAYNLEFDNQNNLWYFSSGDGKMELNKLNSSCEEKKMYGIGYNSEYHAEPNGNAWIINREGGYILNIIEINGDGKVLKDFDCSYVNQITTDSDGNLWGIDGADVEKLEGEKFVKKYTTNINKDMINMGWNLSLYDESNISIYRNDINRQSEVQTGLILEVKDKAKPDVDNLQEKYNLKGVVLNVIQEENQIIALATRNLYVIKNGNIREFGFSGEKYLSYLQKLGNEVYLYDFDKILKINIDTGETVTETFEKYKEVTGGFGFTPSTVIDSSGNKWVDTRCRSGYKLFRIKPTGDVKDFGGYVATSNIICDKNDGIWFTAPSKDGNILLVNINKDGLINERILSTEKNLYIYDIEMTSTGDIWANGWFYGPKEQESRIIHYNKKGEKLNEYSGNNISWLQLDKDGIPWIKEDNSIKKFINGNFVNKYSMNKDMNSFSVYSDNNIALQYDSYVAHIGSYEDGLKLKSITPSMNQKDVALNKRIEINFNNALKQKIDISKISIIDGSGKKVVFLADVKNSTLTIALKTSMEKNKKYTVTMQKGGVQNSEGKQNDFISFCFYTVKK